MVRVLLSSLVVFALLLQSCNKDENEEIEVVDIEVMDIDAYAEMYFPEAVPVEGLGMYVIHKEEGSGEILSDGDVVYAYYKGKLLDAAPDMATAFDTTHQVGFNNLLTFKLDLDESVQRAYIKGWYRGFSQLRKGGKAVFLIPDSLAYGDKRRGIIPPNAALMFEVESRDVK